MDIEGLRRLVREEVEGVLDEDARLDSHPKFRRLVERRLGRRLDGDCHGETWDAWRDLQTEAAGGELDPTLVDYYVNEAVGAIRSTER